MKKAYSFCILCLVFFCTSLVNSAPLIYQLVNFQKNADLDYQHLQQFSRYPLHKKTPLTLTRFKIVKGHFHVYQYLATYHPLIKDTEIINPVVHYLLIVKTNSQHKILDAYHYMLEWEDEPTLALYRLQNKNLSLSKMLPLAAFQFETSSKKRLALSGFLDDYWQGKRIFPMQKNPLKKITLNFSRENISRDGNQIMISLPPIGIPPAYHSYYLDAVEFQQKFGNWELFKNATLEILITHSRKLDHSQEKNMDSPMSSFILWEHDAIFHKLIEKK